MYLPHNIPIISNVFPKRIPVFIEVSKGSKNKYEYNPKAGFLVLDRVLHSSVVYPFDYGFAPQTICGDGDQLDVLVMGSIPLIPGCFVNVRPICYIVMEDEKGVDEKVLSVLDADPNFTHIKNYEDIPSHTLKEISHFFETYKQLEKGKWVKVGEWKNTKDTYDLIEKTYQQYMQNQKVI